MDESSVLRRSAAAAAAVVVFVVLLVGHSSSPDQTNGAPARSGTPIRSSKTPGALEQTDDEAIAAAAATGGGGCTVTAAGVFLSDVSEALATEFLTSKHVGYGQLGLGESLGFESKTFSAGGIPYHHGVSMHADGAWAAEQAYAEFDLEAASKALGCSVGAGWQKLEGKVAINDHNNFRGRPGSAMTFEVLGDGTLLWKSPAIQKTGDVQELSVPIVGVKKLRLKVTAAGSNACAHTVWLDPKILVAAQ